MTNPLEQDPGARRSPILAIAAIGALAVAAWGLLGGPNLPEVNALPWILIGLGLIAGLVLIVSGIRRN